MSTVNLEHSTVNLLVVKGLQWQLFFKLYNKDGSVYTAPTSMVMGFKTKSETPVCTLSSLGTSPEIVVTQNAAQVDVVITISAAHAALFADDTTYDYTLAKTEDGIQTICFDGEMEVSKSALA